jgi:Putative transposase
MPIPYFHIVFTLPHDLNSLIQQNEAKLYKLLFASASATLLEFGHNRFNAQIGVTAVLHTWSQTLLDHYHLHCIVTGGGLCADGSWKSVRPHWLFPVRALFLVFRGKFRDGLLALLDAGELEFQGQVSTLADPKEFRRLVRSACRPKWTVYAKRPFAGPEQVLAYLSRYTHRVGISNRRILALDAAVRTVSFEYKDYADHASKKTMTLDLDEFIRRFRLHILRPRFVKIRHFGMVSNRNRHARIAEARKALNVLSPVDTERKLKTQAEKSETSLVCPHCRQPRLVLIDVSHGPRWTPHPNSFDSS